MHTLISSHITKFINRTVLNNSLYCTSWCITWPWCILSIGSVKWLRLLSLLCWNCFIHEDPLSFENVSLALQKDRLERRGVKTTLGFTMTKQVILRFAIFVWEQYQWETFSKCDPAFISSGYTHWKEATTTFKRHQASACRREANEALVVLPQQIRGEIG